MAKAKAKAAVKRKPAKAQARAPVVRAAKAQNTVKAQKKAAATKVAAPSATKPAKVAAAKASAAPAGASKKAPMAPAQRSAEPLTLPARPVEVSVAKPAPVVRKSPDSGRARADLPPVDGFTLLVDGHFKSSFGDLKDATAAAAELKGRFPMLKVEIYDAAKKTRLPA